jgi:protein SCO1
MAGLAMNAWRCLLLPLALSACSGGGQGSAPAQPPLAGAAIGGPFALVDQDGRAATDRSFAGRYRIMYFGYTFCPDVCPTDAQKIGAAVKLLEGQDAALAARVVPVFVTVDPERDTPAVLKAFVRAFHPRFVGLTGSPQAVAAAAKAYLVYYKKNETSAGGSYLMDHSRQVYLMDPAGKPLALLPVAEGTPETIAAEIRRWAR